jgi:hypothetical protein
MRQSPRHQYECIPRWRRQPHLRQLHAQLFHLQSSHHRLCNDVWYVPVSAVLIAGKEMYHEECFRCQECHATISGTVYANTSKGVYCVTCHNERMTRSRKHHEERKRRAKERSERRAREREKSSPGNTVDRDKSLPAPPPEPSPNLSSHTLSPVRPLKD